MNPTLHIVRLCLALALIWGLALPCPAQAAEQAPEREQAQAEPPEPPPAPLQTVEETAPPAAAPAPARPRISLAETPAERGARIRTAAGWTGAAITGAFIVAGTALGVLAKQRSDDVSRSTTQLVDGRPPVYDAAQQAAFVGLQNDGQVYNRATIACFLVAGVTAVASGLLFWDAMNLRPKQVALLPSFAASSGSLTLSGRF